MFTSIDTGKTSRTPKATMAPTLCGGAISSRRGLLASLWSLVIILTAIAFLTALVFALSSGAANANSYYNDDNSNNGGHQNQQNDMDPQIAVTSRALAFSALWTAVLAALMAVFGTVILGWQSPTGLYYTCCSASVHRTTPLGLGSFIGALLMFANLTLVCSVLFGEFEIRDFREGEEEEREGGGNNWNSNQSAYNTVEKSSMCFSIMCMFLTVLYAGFAALTFAFAHNILDEHAIDEREESMISSTRNKNTHFNGYDGYIGERFDVHGRTRNGGFVSPTPPEGTMS